MQPRMTNPATILPEAMPAIQALQTAIYKAGVPGKTLALAHLRASQINGCSVCVDGGVRHANYQEAARHFDERALAGLILWIATTNLFNRVNAATRQIAGAQSW